MRLAGCLIIFSPCNDIPSPQFAPRSAYGIFYILSLDTRTQKVYKFLTLYFDLE